MKTGTPRALKFSASVCSVTVFPVPVAPAINPWRFAIFGSKKICSFDCATRIGSAMTSMVDLRQLGSKHRTSNFHHRIPHCSQACVFILLFVFILQDRD